MYARHAPDDLRVIDRWDGGVGWIAHPAERGRRASHAIRGDAGGVWVFDPLDAPGVDDLLAEVGEVVGVAVLSNYHARDAGAVAERHGVPVSVPAWIDRIGDRVDAPIERRAGTLGDSGFLLRRSTPLPGWREAIAYRESDGTLYVPDVLSSAPDFVVGDERIGVYLPGRLSPPRDLFAGLVPERILVGHGEGIFEDAEGALADSLDGARRRFPRALLTTGWAQLRAGLDAL